MLEKSNLKEEALRRVEQNMSEIKERIEKKKSFGVVSFHGNTVEEMFKNSKAVCGIGHGFGVVLLGLGVIALMQEKGMEYNSNKKQQRKIMGELLSLKSIKKILPT